LYFYLLYDTNYEEKKLNLVHKELQFVLKKKTPVKNDNKKKLLGLGTATVSLI